MITDPILDILVVEDDMNSSILAEKIKNEFHENVRIHKNGRGIANDLNIYKDLDLIIVDEQFSKEDIMDTLKLVRKKSPYTEVIVLSSETETGAMENIKRAGAYDYIYKDRSAMDKVVYVIKAFWSNKRLKSENLSLRETKKKSKSSTAIIIIFALAAIAALIYFLTK